MKKLNGTPSERADIIHQAAMLYLASNIPIDYGTGEKYTMVEVHMLKYIIDNPGKTVTDLSFEWDRTKAAISLMLKNMEQKNLIRHQPSQENHKKQLYFATEKGLTLNEAHRKYDDEVFGKTLEFLRETCSEEDIATCFDVLREFINARRRKHYQAK